MNHSSFISNPRQAALQGLEKMKRVMDLGITQAVLPPPERPSVNFLRSAGFTGSDAQVIEKAARAAPALLQVAASASSMWRANSATVTPSSDSIDGRVHLTVANLNTQFHRSLEAKETLSLFRFLFRDPEIFVVHSPLPFPDEGAANHIRFCCSLESRGIHLYVYGRNLLSQEVHTFPARQTREASEAIARIHGGTAVFARQNPELIDKGVFHNDVISCGNREIFLYHEKAFVDTDGVINEIQKHFPIQPIKAEIQIDEAIRSYLFNSQLLTLPDQTRLLLAPEECRDLSLGWLPFPIEFVDIRQSMQNGGGPACLRLAIPLTEEEIKKIHQPIFLSQDLYVSLKNWIEKHYRDRLSSKDLGDPILLQESRNAHRELHQILKI